LCISRGAEIWDPAAYGATFDASNPFVERFARAAGLGRYRKVGRKRSQERSRDPGKRNYHDPDRACLPATHAQGWHPVLKAAMLTAQDRKNEGDVA
jgi:hypothetical protein